MPKEDLSIKDKIAIVASLAALSLSLFAFVRDSVLNQHVLRASVVSIEEENDRLRARRERREKRTVLFPIRLDDVVMRIESGWPADIRRTRHIGDFRKWKSPDLYLKKLQSLLHDLKSDSLKVRT